MRTSKKKRLWGCLALCLSLTACGGGGGGGGGGETPTPAPGGNDGNNTPTPPTPPTPNTPVFTSGNATESTRTISDMAFRPASVILMVADYIQFANVAVSQTPALANQPSIDYLCNNQGEVGVKVFLKERKVSFSNCLAPSGNHNGTVQITPSEEAGINLFTLQGYSLTTSKAKVDIHGQFKVTIIGDPNTQTVLRRAESDLVRYDDGQAAELTTYRYQQTQNLSEGKRYSEVQYTANKSQQTYTLKTLQNFVGQLILNAQSQPNPSMGKWEVVANDNSRLELNADSGAESSALLTVQEAEGATISNSENWQSLLNVYQYGL